MPSFIKTGSHQGVWGGLAKKGRWKLKLMGKSESKTTFGRPR